MTAATSSATFSERFLGLRIALGMLRTRRQLDEAEPPQLLADRALVHHDAEPPLDHALKVDQPPAGFWSVRKFGDDIFAGSSEGLVRFSPTSRSVIQQIDSFSDAFLWIVTDRHAVRFDGARYEMFRHPDNV